MLGDAHNLPFRSECADVVICTEVLEHCKNPSKVVDESYRILKNSRTLILSVPFLFPVHSDHDYWRFTPQGFDSLFRCFESRIVMSVGEVIFPHTVICIATKGQFNSELCEIIDKVLQRWKKRWSRPWLYRLKSTIRYLIPPILVSLFFKLRRSVRN